MSAKMLIGLLLGAVSIGYPILVYYGLNHFGPSALALFLLVILILRVLIKGSLHEPSQWLQLVVLGTFCCVVMLVNSEELLRFYPVIMSLGFSALFAFSLKSKTSLIERFAKMSGQDYPEAAIEYMRNLSKIWAMLLFVNAFIAAYTACCVSLKSWTLYNGLIAYFLLGGFAVGELSLLIPSDLSWFVGHFPEQPVLPGVVQTHWACELAQHFFLIKDLRKVKNLKFKTMVLPNISLDLELKFNDQKNTVSFEYKNQEESFSTAILQFNQD